LSALRSLVALKTDVRGFSSSPHAPNRCPMENLDLTAFTTRIWQYHAEHRRPFPWRDQISPYYVLVSEVMLQQTQAPRVVAKFESFIEQFPDFLSLAHAPFHDVLKQWKGLGYNRRALALQKTAQAIVESYLGVLPDEPDILVTLPGIGKATASSIVAFAFNKPVVFIETNIRTVFIHAFFPERTDVHDRELIPLIAACVDKDAPREWYYALMDYGVMLKKTVGNLSQQSAHYHRQSPFLGSDRQIRGQILEALLQHQQLPKADLHLLLKKDASRVERMLNDLCAEGLVKHDAGVVRIC
jgi:A/G-specific adenine glycosylase